MGGVQIRPRDRTQRRRADAVADHLHRGRLAEAPAVGGAVDDVAIGEALGPIQLGRRQHAQADVDDDVGRAVDDYGDQRQAVLGGDGGHRLAQVSVLAAGAVVAHQERGDLQGAGLCLRRQRALDRGMVLTAGADGRQRVGGIGRAARATQFGQMGGDESLRAALADDGADRLARIVPDDARVGLLEECGHLGVLAGAGDDRSERLVQARHARRLAGALTVSGLHQRGRSDRMTTAGRDGPQRLLDIAGTRSPPLRAAGAAIPMRGLHQRRRHHRMRSAARLRRDRAERISAVRNAIGRRIGALHDERIGRVQHVSADTLGDAPTGSLGQRPLAGEDRRAWDRPVDAVRRGHIWMRAARAVGRLRPADGLAVAARHHEQAVAAGAGAIVAGDQAPVLNHVAQRLQRADELTPGAAGAALVRHQMLTLQRHALAKFGDAVRGLSGGWVGDRVQRDDATCGLVALGHQRTPLQDLAHVLQADDARRQPMPRQRAGDLDDHPAERARGAAARLAALGLAEMRAIGRGMEPAHAPAGDLAQDVDLPHVGVHVPGERVVGCVHADRVCVVVHGHVGVAAQRLAQRLTGAAASGKEVDHDLARAQLAVGSPARPAKVGLSGSVSHGPGH